MSEQRLISRYQDTIARLSQDLRETKAVQARDVVGVTTPDGKIELQWQPGQRQALCSRELLEDWVGRLNELEALVIAIGADIHGSGEWWGGTAESADALRAFMNAHGWEGWPYGDDPRGDPDE